MREGVRRPAWSILRSGRIIDELKNMINLSDQLIKNLLQRAYSYVDGGAFEVEEWTAKMIKYLEAYNDLLGLSKQDAYELAEELWRLPYKVGDVGHSIGRWALLKKEQTAFQTEMRNSIDRLFKAIEDYRSSRFFLELLKFCANFKLLAPYNAMMVRTQMPEARYVLTEKNWREMYKRRPKRNARPLIILRKFGPVDYVFEIGDTEPIPGVLFPTSEEDILASIADPYATTGVVSKELYENLIQSLAYYGIDLDYFRVGSSFAAEIRKAPCKVMVKGVEANGHFVISLNNSVNDSTNFASICHELGHFFCYHLTAPKKGNEDWWKWRKLTWEQKEFEAEIVSYIICERYGVGNKSWEYLSHVLGKNGVIPDGISIDRVFKAANEVERMLKDDLDPRSCYLYFNDATFKKQYDSRYPKQINSDRIE